MILDKESAVPSAKDLGVTTDASLTFDETILM